MTQNTVAERVQRGVEVLDKHFGSDWKKRIDLIRFNMRSAHDCILGQLSDKKFYELCKSMDIHWRNSWWYGFDCYIDVESAYQAELEYQALQSEWVLRLSA